MITIDSSALVAICGFQPDGSSSRTPLARSRKFLLLHAQKRARRLDLLGCRHERKLSLMADSGQASFFGRASRYAALSAVSLHFGRCAHKQIFCLLVHREHDHLAQILLAAKQHDDAVDAGRDAAMGRRSILQRTQHAAEALLEPSFGYPAMAKAFSMISGL